MVNEAIISRRKLAKEFKRRTVKALKPTMEERKQLMKVKRSIKGAFSKKKIKKLGSKVDFNKAF